jgi:subtilisin family serine protease
MRKPALLQLAMLAAIAACQDSTEPPTAPAAPTPALMASGRAVPGQYIVVFHREVADVPGLARRLVRAQQGTLLFTYSAALKGFAARLPAPAAAALARHPDVASVEPDRSIQLDESPVSILTTQANPPWGLDRIDQRALPLSASFTYTRTGAGVHAYILDSGIRYTHREFGGRAVFGFDAIGDGRNGEDCFGHGTGTASITGGATFGVAKEVTLVAVRFADCTGGGAFSGVIAAVDWVTANHIKPAVANMSFGGTNYAASPAFEEAVHNLVAAGVVAVTGAGNFNGDACTISPARIPEMITIAGSTIRDRRSMTSSWGACIDWFAPGEDITAAWSTSDSASVVETGTSFATPHTTGVAALYLEGAPGATPQQARDALYAATTKGVIKLAKSANNHLLFTSF